MSSIRTMGTTKTTVNVKVRDSHQQLVAHVTGRVQGVGFRYFVRTAAKRLEITGWIRNEKNGTVCVVAEGSPIRLKHLLQALRTGPSLATVRRVLCEWHDPTGQFQEFTILS